MNSNQVELQYAFQWEYIAFYDVFVIRIENKTDTVIPTIGVHFMRKDQEFPVATFSLYCPKQKESTLWPSDLAPGEVAIFKTHNTTADALKELASSLPPEQYYLRVESNWDKEVARVPGEVFGRILAEGPKDVSSRS